MILLKVLHYKEVAYELQLMLVSLIVKKFFYMLVVFFQYLLRDKAEKVD